MMLPDRALQARREIGETAVSGLARWTLLLAFWLPLVGVAVYDTVAAGAGWLATLGEGSESAARLAGTPVAANRELQRAIDAAEKQLEDDSRVRRALLAPAQWILAVAGGVGNEQAYLGRDGWLFFRADVDHVGGRGFLEPRVLERRSRGGKAWEPAPQPDPRPALLALGRALEERGITLVVVPTPLKPTVHPERFTRRLAAGSAPRNPSTESLLDWLREAGVRVVDPAPLLAAKAPEAAQYLGTDTHWRPEAMALVARELARLVEELLGEPATAVEYRRRQVPVEARGDIAAMLPLPEERSLVAPERVEIQRVETLAGRAWRPDPRAEILLLGDSFTNIFSDPALGWGASGGLAEQLAFELRRPVDRIAVNAGGAWATRQALSRPAPDGGDRLAGKRLVIYQFAARELSSGDWKPVAID